VAKSKKPFSNEEKAAFVLLLIIGFFGVVFGFKSFGFTLSRPFEIQLAAYTGDEVLTISQQEEIEIQRQKITDTDNDGLFDYDELYIYKTSPYLIDSDSDGIDDATEIFSNQDPNCPAGKDCYGKTTPVTSAEEAVDTTSQAVAGLSGLFKFGSVVAGSGAGSAEEALSYFSSMSVDEIRDLLISQGVPKETVDAMSDQEIQDLLNSTLTQINEQKTSSDQEVPIGDQIQE